MLHLDGNTIVSQPDGQREHFIPLHSTDLVEFLTLHPALNEEEQQHFRKIASLILSLLHHAYRQRHERLTYVYSPLDPDRDRLLRTVPTSTARNVFVRELSDSLHDAMLRANYHRLTPHDIQQALKAASRWGVRMRVSFKMLTKLEVYGRGYVIGEREFRNWRKFFKKDRAEVPLYQRIVVLFRVSDELRSSQFDARHVYLRMFKNIPRQDIDMMLPVTGVQMSWLDHSKIVVPSLYAAAMTFWRFLRNVVLLAFFGVFKTLALIVFILVAVGFGLKSMFTYRSATRRRYMLNMTQNLYYQNLDNNNGVLLRLLDEGEQQEACEAILAYFAGAVVLGTERAAKNADIDLACEALLQEATGTRIDFDVDRTLRGLAELGLMDLTSDGWKAKSMRAALQQLDRRWDNWFDRTTTNPRERENPVR